LVEISFWNQRSQTISFGSLEKSEPGSHWVMVFQKPLKINSFMKEYVILGVIISFLQKI
jgi:hypothetical protein